MNATSSSILYNLLQSLVALLFGDKSCLTAVDKFVVFFYDSVDKLNQ